MSNWLEIVGLLLGSSLLSTVVTLLFNRKKDKQEMEFNYTDKLENRLEKLERRVETLEFRDNVYSSATACAHACRLPEDYNCPVLFYLETHPVPEKQ